MESPSIDFFVALERRVWQAMVEGDMDTDKRLLDPAFLGVYASGFASRDDHVGQLGTGPTVKTFSMHEVRLMPLAADTVLLAYKATYTPTATPKAQGPVAWYVSSIWKQRAEGWVNVFSQDTSAAA